MMRCSSDEPQFERMGGIYLVAWLGKFLEMANGAPFSQMGTTWANALMIRVNESLSTKIDAHTYYLPRIKLIRVNAYTFGQIAYTIRVNGAPAARIQFSSQVKT